MTKQNKKILLVQIREDQVVRDHELSGILAVSKLSPGDITLHDLTKKPVESADLSGHCALVIGGSGEYSAYEDFPNRDSLVEITRVAMEQNLPVLGLCFGAQFIADEFGGECISDRDNEEIGTFSIATTPACAEDKLLCDYPEMFNVIEGHNCRIAALSEDAVVLAKSARCPVQAYRMKDNVYGVQFHPELSREGLIWRLNYYADLYVDSTEQIDKIISSAEDTPEANRLLNFWLERIVGWD